MTHTLSLSEAKARLSEVVRQVRTSGIETVITLDGRPAVRVVPVPPEPRDLTDAEIATCKALMGSLDRGESVTGAFDALALVAEGRR